MNNRQLVSCLWFEKDAEAAANLYVSVFKDSKIIKTIRYGKEGQEVHGQKEGDVFTVEFNIRGQQFVAFNGSGGPGFNEAVSFQVLCDTQDEIDYYWNRLTADGGQESQCGWLKDKFGLSWQVVPAILPKLLADPSRRDKVMHVFMKMKKFNIAELESA
jgi:predicted 3-demethylubiquinone-9 3-methyltransferase (glyoxalase superfamily)